MPANTHSLLLSDDQVSCLRLAARGVSLRFEEPSIVDALIAVGLATRNFAGVVAITQDGRDYLVARSARTAHAAAHRGAHRPASGMAA
jgi:hypothetical protein